jgi:hypothetical protein
MQVGVEKKIVQWPLILWAPVIAYYMILFVGLVYSPFYEASLELANGGDKRNIYETAFIEHLEAILWMVGFVSYGLLALINRRDHAPFIWPLFFAFICFFAFGEELSWGQHLFQYETPESVTEINAQGELNFHNLHLASVFGISSDHPLYPYMGNLTQYLNPIFYLFCTFIWVVLPVFLHDFNGRSKFKLLRNFPAQTPRFYLSFLFFIVAYLLIDNLILDVGELFELTLASAGAITGLTQLNAAKIFQ